MSSTVGATMGTAPVDAPTAAAIEAAEIAAWADLYAAAPPAFAARAGVGARTVGGALVLSWAATGRRYFSRAIGLGVTAPATEAALDDILSGWRERGIGMFLLATQPHVRPGELADWLRERGLEPFDAQDRIVRGAGPLGDRGATADGRDLRVERVERDTAGEWSDFVQRVYRLDTGDWLPRLVGRPGWSQYVAREDGEIVAARGMFVGIDGTAWLGMDGPVPGITTDDHVPDTAVCAALVRDGLERGARRFIADIEAPSPGLDTPAYARFARLGFTRPYVRTHWTVR